MDGNQIKPVHFGLSIGRDSKPRRLSGAGLPRDLIDWRRTFPLLPEKNGAVCFMVHGFGYDPASLSDENPHWSTFEHWRDHLTGPKAFGFGWYSAPPGLRNVAGAWWSGRWNRYRLAWDLAESASSELALCLARRPGASILCHSLGSRVVLSSLCNISSKSYQVRNVVFLNGAAHRGQAIAAARCNPDTGFFNLCVETDDVLRVPGSLFSPDRLRESCIGQAGLGPDAPENWYDIFLDDPDVQAWGRARGWDLQGDNPNKISDHWYSHKYPGNWPLIRALLESGQPVP